MECFDPAGFGSFLYVNHLQYYTPTNSNSPTVQMHVHKNEDGQPVPVIGTDDVAKGIAYLASDDAKMVNGALLPIDAAWSTL